MTGDCKNCLDLGYILQIQVADLIDGLDAECEGKKKRRIRSEA